MILACHNIEKAFGEREIVRDGSFHIEDREKAALVGVNGAGKSSEKNLLMVERLFSRKERHSVILRSVRI